MDQLMSVECRLSRSPGDERVLVIFSCLQRFLVCSNKEIIYCDCIAMADLAYGERQRSSYSLSQTRFPLLAFRQVAAVLKSCFFVLV